MPCSKIHSQYWYWYWSIGVFASIGIGFGIENPRFPSIGIGIGIDFLSIESIGIGIGIDFGPVRGIGIGIGLAKLVLSVSATQHLLAWNGFIWVNEPKQFVSLGYPHSHYNQH